MPDQLSAHSQNPFVGLRAYRYGEQLFGRDREAKRLCDTLLGNRLVLLHAPSGAGKTSLVEALVRSLLKNSGIGVQIGLRANLSGGIRLNASPPKAAYLPEDLNRYVFSVISVLEESKPEVERLKPDEVLTLDLPKYLESLSEASEGNLDFLHFDQFEEILRLDERDIAAKEMFFQQLGLALYNRRWLVIFSIRDEYVGAIEPYLRNLPTRLSARFRMDRLNPEAARDAIVKTAAPQRNFRDEAVDTLFEDSNLVDKSSGFVDPSILQVVCRNLWDAIPPERTDITQEDVREFDANKALRQFYQQGIEKVWRDPQLGVSEAAIRNWFSEELIASRVRNTILRGDQTTGGLPNQSVDRLVGERLVVGEQRRGQMWYELTHDALIDPILASNQEYKERFERDLLIQEQTAEANRQIEMVTRQKEEAERQRRELLHTVRLIAGVVIAGVILVILVAATAYVWTSYQTFPLKEGVLAYTSKDDSQEISILEGGSVGYLKTLLPILGENPRTLDFDQRCETGNEAQSQTAVVKTTNPAFSTDGRLAFTVDDSCIFVETAARSGKYRQLTDNGREPAWSPDGRRIAFTRLTLGDNCPSLSDIYIMNTDGTGNVINVREKYAPEMPPGVYRLAAFSPDGNYIAFESSLCASLDPNSLSDSLPGDSQSTSSGHSSDIWIAYVGQDDEATCSSANITESTTAGTSYSHPFWLDQERILVSIIRGERDNSDIVALKLPDPCAGSSLNLALDPFTGYTPADEDSPVASPNRRIVLYRSNLLGNSQPIIVDLRRCPGSDPTCKEHNWAVLDVPQIVDMAYWVTD
jgi:hypothetical protein